MPEKHQWQDNDHSELWSGWAFLWSTYNKMSDIFYIAYDSLNCSNIDLTDLDLQQQGSNTVDLGC